MMELLWLVTLGKGEERQEEETREKREREQNPLFLVLPVQDPQLTCPPSYLHHLDIF
jgi:hypothetical protein